MASVSTTSAYAFGIALKRARRAARMTQAQLAERAGFSVVYISMLERGTRQPQRTTVALLAEALDFSTDERVALETAAQAPTTDATGRRRGGDDAGTPHLAVGGFLGAVPAGQLIGRERELAVIQEALEAVASGQGRLLVLVGEPGVGKTRLAQEITLRARAHGFLVATGCCYEPQQTVAYYPFLAALSQIFAAASTAHQREVARRWPLVTRLLPQHELEPPTPDALSMDPGGGEDARQRLYWQVAGFLRAVVSECPLAVLLDDLHWADAGSLELVRQLAHVLRGEPILFVGTYRDVEVGRQHPLEGALRDLTREDLLERLAVRRLGEEETSALIGATLGAHDGAVGDAATVAADLAQRIYARSEGNAFFTRQLARALYEQGDLAFAEGQWRLGNGATPAVSAPESIRSVIGQRLDRLTLLTQEVLREASVLGQVFAFEDLQRMASRGEQEIEEALEEAAGIVREGEQDRYHFNHALTRDTLYAELSARRKRRLHRAAADAIKQTPDHERRAAELAYHLLAADEGERALPYAVLAGDQAEAIYAHTEAAGHFRAALDLARELGDQSHEAAALEKLGNALYLDGRNDEAVALLTDALRASQALDDRDGELRALSALLETQAVFGRALEDEAVTRAQAILARLEPQDTSDLTPALISGLAAVYGNLAWVYWTAGRYQESVRVGRRAAELARAIGDEARLAEVLFRLYIAGDREEHGATLEDILAMAERSGQTEIVVSAHTMIAARYREAGEFALGMPHMEQSVAVAERNQNPTHLAWQLTNFTEFLFDFGDWQRAREVFSRAASIMRAVDRHGTTWNSVGMSIWPGIFALAEGREDDVRRLLEHAIERIENAGSVFMLQEAICPLAEADLLAGRAEQARLLLTSLLQSSHPTPAEGNALGAHLLLAWVEGEMGQVKQAEERLAACLAAAKPLFRVDALRVWGLLATLQGYWAVADEALDEALASARAMPYPYAEAKTLWAYGRLEVARGDAAAARERFTAALPICDRLGEGFYRKYIAHDLAALQSPTGPASP